MKNIYFAKQKIEIYIVHREINLSKKKDHRHKYIQNI